MATIKKTTAKKKAPTKRAASAGKTKSGKVATSPRLKARRKANTKPGYYPNPSEVAAAHRVATVKKETHPFHVQKEVSTDKWDTVGKFATAADAMVYARLYAKKTTKPIRAVKV